MLYLYVSMLGPSIKNVDVSGMPGTGKTATVHAVMQKLMEEEVFL